jgi:hypothetical protein
MSWDKGIRDSSIFLVIIATEAYFQNAISYCQAEYAKELKKPFAILLKKGVSIPPGFMDDIDNYQIETWETKEELSSATKRILDSYQIYLKNLKEPKKRKKNS